MDADEIGRPDESLRPGALLHRTLTRRLIGLFFDVYNDLRPGFLESVYSTAFEIACHDEGLRVEREVPVPVWFRGRPIIGFRADFVVEAVVIVEVKVVRGLDEVHAAQLLNYLRATELEVGLLLNFGAKPQFRRMILENRRKPIRVHPRRSAVPPAVRQADQP